MAIKAIRGLLEADGLRKGRNGLPPTGIFLRIAPQIVQGSDGRNTKQPESEGRRTGSGRGLMSSNTTEIYVRIYICIPVAIPAKKPVRFSPTLGYV